MTWQNAYSQSLTGNGGNPGSATTYVTRVQVSVAGDYVRFGLRGPTSGSFRVQEAWAGLGSAPSFDGGQVQLKVGGNTSFTLSGGELVWTDPVPLTVAVDDMVVVAFDALAGDYYRYASVSGGRLWWKSGQEAAQTTKSSYSGPWGDGKAMVVEAVEVGNDIEPPEEPDPPPEEPEGEPYSMSSADQVINGERFSCGGYFTGQSGKYLHLQLYNPSSKLALLYQVVITADQDAKVGLRTWSSSGPQGTVLPPCNLLVGFGAPESRVRYGFRNQVDGADHGFYKVKAKVPYTIRADVPIFGLGQDKGCVVVVEEAGVGATVNFEWREVSLA